jgi:type II secretory pathway pseudopilin PulG
VAGTDLGYDAFISYSHELDDALARALQTGVERFAKPWYRQRALRVFRDNTNLTANPNLWAAIEKALASSTWLVLMASPDAALSPWVNREVAWWLANKSSQRLLVVLTEGEFAGEDHSGHGDEATVALPPALRGALVETPRWVDLRGLHDVDQVDQASPRLRECVADVAAAVREVPKDMLVGEHIRQHRRTMRLARGGATALAVFLIAALVAAVVAVGQRNQAREQARIATARQLIAQADAVRLTDPRSALLLSIAAHRIYANNETRSNLVNGITTTQYIRTLTGHNDVVRSVAFSAAGRTLATAGDDNTIILWDISDPAQPRRLGQFETGRLIHKPRRRRVR